jgi:hypothetical protein
MKKAAAKTAAFLFASADKEKSADAMRAPALLLR